MEMIKQLLKGTECCFLDKDNILWRTDNYDKPYGEKETNIWKPEKSKYL